MARKFSITAVLGLQGPANLNQVVSSINKQLSNINATVNLKINQQSAKNLLAINKQITNMNGLLANLVTNSNNARNSLQQLSQVFNNNNTTITNTNKALAASGSQARKTGQQFSNAKSAIEDFGFKSALAIKRFAAFSIPAGALLAFTTAVKSGIKSSIEFQNELVRLSQVTGRSLSGLQPLVDEITRLSIQFGVSSSELSKVSVTLAQAGLSAKDTRIALEALAKTEVAPTFDNITDTTEGAIAILQQFGIEAKDLESTLSSLNSVAAAFAVESADIITAVRRTGGAFRAAGGDFNELIALFTSVRQTTRESAETIATGFRTIFTRLQRPQTIKFLQEFGINLQDLEGKFVGPYEAVLRLSAGLANLDTRDLKFAQITEELGGFRQISKVIPLIQQASVAQRALSIAQAGADSLARDAATAQGSYARQIAQVREEFEALFRTITSSNSFQVLLDGILKATSFLIKLTEAASGVIPVLGAVFAVKGAKAIGQFGRGFANQFTGAQQFGANVGATLGGARAATGTSASAITSNTTAIASLNNTMQRLNQAIITLTARVGGPTGFASRPPRKFATGGLVPGRGNSDNVLTSLMPGEYVLRKKAVQNLGLDRVSELNKAGVPKYAKAGKQKPLKAIDLTIGDYAGHISGLFFNKQKEGGGKNPITSRKFSSLGIGPERTAAFVSQVSQQLGIPDLQPQDISDIKVPLQRHYLGEGPKKVFEERADRGIMRAIRNIVDSYGKGFNKPNIDDGDISKIAQSISLATIKGVMYEGVVQGLVRDFPLPGDLGRTFDFEPSGRPTSGFTFAELFGPNAANAKFADAKFTDTPDAIDSLVAKSIAKASLGPQAGLKIKKFARGGPSPALVTPGEFIVDAKSASRIGVGQLNKINRFAGGGFVNPFRRKKRSFGDLRAQVTNNVQRDEDGNRIGSRRAHRAAAFRAASNPLNNININAFGVASGNLPASAAIGRRNRASASNITRSAISNNRFSNFTSGAALGVAFAGPQLANSVFGANSKTGAGISGALTGAATGASLGSVLGPWGAAIGGAAGALVGLTSALKEQSEKIRELELTPILEKLTEDIQKINSNQIIPSSQTSQGLVEAIGKIREEAGIRGQATLFEAFKSSFGFDQTEAQVTRRKSFLSSSINGAELLRAVQTTAGQFRTSEQFLNTGGNTQLLRDAAELTGKSFNELKTEIETQITLQQKEAKQLQSVNDFLASMAELNVVNQLSDAFNEINLTATQMSLKFDSLSGAIDGSIGQFQAIDISELFKSNSLITSDAKTLVNSTISDILEPLGGTGEEIKGRILDIFTLKSALPNILGKVANTPLLDVEGELEDAFAGLLGGLDIDNALRLQLTDIFRAQVGNNKGPEIQQEIRKNPAEFGAKLLASQTDILEPLANIAKARTDNLNTLFGRIQKVVENSLKIEESKRTLGEQEIDLLEFRNRKNKDFFLSAAQITAPFNQSLQNLGGGLDATQLSSAIQEGLKKQQELQQKLQANPNSTDRNALLEVNETLGKQRAALTLLTQSIQEATKVQAELGKVESRLADIQKQSTNAVDKVLFGNAEDRQSLFRALQIQKIAGNPQALSKIPPNILKDALDNFEASPDLFGGEETAKTLRKSLLSLFKNLNQAQIDAILKGPASLLDKQKALQEEVIRLTTQGNTALQTEIDLRAKLNDALKTTALDEFNTKALKLAQAFDQIRLNILQNAALEATGELGKTKNQKGAADALLEILPGLKSVENIRNFTGSASVQKLIEQNVKTDTLKRAGRFAIRDDNTNVRDLLKITTAQEPDASGEGLNTVTKELSTQQKTKLFNELKTTELGNLLSPEVVQKIIDSRAFANERDNIRLAGGTEEEQFSKQQRFLNDALAKAKDEQLKIEQQTLREARNRTITASGGQVNEAQLNTFLNNLGLVNQLLADVPPGTNIETLTAQIKALEAQAIKSVNLLNNALGVERDPRFQPAQPFAAGGSIFRKRGTDTVPAMLTPGEFVINRASAQANAGLVKQINDARGPVYLAEGGFTPAQQARLKELKAEERRQIALQDLLNRSEISNQAHQTALDRAPKFTTENLDASRKLAIDTRARTTRLAKEFLAREAFGGIGIGGLFPVTTLPKDKIVQAEIGRQRGIIGSKNREQTRLAELEKTRQSKIGLDKTRATERAKARRNRLGIGDTQITAGLNASNRASARKARLKARGFADGGFVSGGIGSGDSVPALLTNGEFVLNRHAASRVGMPTLQKLNKGGPVQYKQNGGVATGSSNNVVDINAAMTMFAQSVSMFSQSVQSLEKLQGMEISMVGNHKVEVIFNGAEILSQLEPSIANMIMSKANSAINGMIKDRFSYSGPV